MTVARLSLVILLLPLSVWLGVQASKWAVTVNSISTLPVPRYVECQ